MGDAPQYGFGGNLLQAACQCQWLRKEHQSHQDLFPHPGGMRDNSPMFQHWGEWINGDSPEGTAE